MILVALLYFFQVGDVSTRTNTGAVAVAAVLAAMDKLKNHWESFTIVNLVIIIVEVGVLLSAIWSWSITTFWSDHKMNATSEPIRDCDTFNFDFEGLTIGQVASASSAAAGVGAVRAWIQNVFDFAREKTDEAMGGLQCRISETLIGQVFYEQHVKDEFMTLLGCNKSETSRTTAERWRGYLHGMAVKMNLSNSTTGESHMSHMAIDAVRLDNAL